MKSCERLAHITNYIFAQGYLPCKVRSLVSWKGACGRHLEESARVEDVLTCGEGAFANHCVRHYTLINSTMELYLSFDSGSSKCYFRMVR